MNIVQWLLENFNHKPVTLRYPGRVSAAAGYRGLVQNDPTLCIGCSTCAYVCSPGAIEVKEQSAGYEWSYDPGRCTFCARCLDYCPVKAISMQSERPPVYIDRDALKEVIRLEYPPCRRCGRPAPPLSLPLLNRIFGEISSEVESWSRLCPQCRRTESQAVFLRESNLSK